MAGAGKEATEGSSSTPQELSRVNIRYRVLSLYEEFKHVLKNRECDTGIVFKKGDNEVTVQDANLSASNNHKFSISVKSLRNPGLTETAALVLDDRHGGDSGLLTYTKKFSTDGKQIEEVDTEAAVVGVRSILKQLQKPRLLVILDRFVSRNR